MSVLCRGTVTGTRKEAARLIGVRIVGSRVERSERRIGFVDAVAVNIIFGSGAGILKVISAVVLVHPGTLDERHAGEETLEAGDFPFRDCGTVLAGLRQKFIQSLLDFFLRAGRCTVILSVSFIAKVKGIAVDQLMCFTDSLHRSGIKLYPVDRSCIVAAIVEVESSVIVNEQSGVPEIKGSRDLLIRPVQNIPGAVEIADDASSGGTEVNIVTDNRNIRSVIIKRKLLGKRM